MYVQLGVDVDHSTTYCMTFFLSSAQISFDEILP